MGDADWFETLAGRTAAGADAVDRLEASVLRAALRHEAQLELDAAALDERQLAAVAPRPPRWHCAACARHWRLLREGLRAPWPRAVLAALVLLLVAGFWRWPREPEPEPVLRGSASEHAGGAWLLASDRPAAARDALARRFAATGAQVTSHESLGRQGLRARWPGPPPEAARGALAALGVPAPAAGEDVGFEFEPSEP